MISGYPNTRECIFKLISTEIGVRWKDLARNLNVPEAEIDKLAATDSTQISERVRHVLRYFETNCMGNAQFKATTLIRALQLSRRRDLANQVQDALDRIGGPCQVLK